MHLQFMHWEKNPLTKIIFNSKSSILEIGTKGEGPTHRGTSGQTCDADHENVLRIFLSLMCQTLDSY